MKIIILVKPVVEAKDISFNEDMTLNRSLSLPSLDMADAHAISVARDLKSAGGGTIDVLSLSPGYPSTLLGQLKAHDVDHIYQICDSFYRGGDTLATARVLASGITYIEDGEPYDLILTGSCSTDSETGQVPSQIASMLSIPVITNAVSVSKESITRLLEDRTEDLIPVFPLVVSCTPKGVELVPPSLSGMRRAKDIPFVRITNKELALKAEECGLAGSCTKVLGNSSRIQKWRKPSWTSDPEEGARWIMDEIFRKEQQSEESVVLKRKTKQQKLPFAVVCPFFDEVGWNTAKEILSEIAYRGEEGIAVVLGEDPAEEEINRSGAKEEWFIPLTDTSDDTVYAKTLSKIFRNFSGEVFFGASIRMRCVAPLISAALNCGLTADCISFSATESGFEQIRPAFEGTSEARIITLGKLGMLTVRPRIYPNRFFEPLSSFSVKNFTLEEVEPIIKARSMTSLVTVASSKSRVMFSIGSGICDRAVRERIASFGCSLGASRKAVCLYGLPYPCQVGQTGKVIHNEVYVAFGISGAAQHIVGISGVKTIIAVNDDPQAPIFQFSDKAICAKAEVVLSYMEKIRRNENGV